MMYRLPENAKVQTENGWKEKPEVDVPCSVWIGDFKYGKEVFDNPSQAVSHGIKQVIRPVVDERYYNKTGETEIESETRIDVCVKLEPKYTVDQLSHRRIQEFNMMFEKMKDKAKADIESLARSGDYQGIIDYRWENENGL